MDVSRWSGFYEAATLTSEVVDGKKVMRVVPGANNHCATVLSGKSGTDGRVLMRARQVSGTIARAFGIALRVNGDASNRNCYALRLTGSAANISRIMSTGTTSSQVTTSTIQNVPGTWYWFDAKIDGGRALLQVWPDGTPRPEGWRLIANMTQYAVGGFGLYVGTNVDPFQVSHFASTFK